MLRKAKINWDVEVGPSKKQFIKDEKPENHYNITEDNFIPILKNHKYLIPEKQEENFKKLIEFKITQSNAESLNDENIYQALKSAVKVTALGVTLAYEWPTRICVGKKEKDKVLTDKNPISVAPIDLNKTFTDVKSTVNSIGQGLGV